MNISHGVRLVMCLGAIGVIAPFVSAEVKVEALDLAPAGHWMCCLTSPHGIYAAVVTMKGSRYVVYLDGVAGPRIDVLLATDGVTPTPFSSISVIPATEGLPVVFSDDGSHNAYFAKAGDEYVLYLDGKELTRGRLSPNAPGFLALQFSAGGKHLIYGEGDSSTGYRVVVDGKPEAWLQSPPQVVISPDGARYAYAATLRGAPKPTVMVDGKDVGNIGEDLQFTADGKHLFTVVHQGAITGLVVDGRLKFKCDGISHLYFAPAGAAFAAVLQTLKPPGFFLVVDGQKVAGSESPNIYNVCFSSDGKHYAAQCGTSGNNQFMIVDGKKGEEYASIEVPRAALAGLWTSTGLAWANGRTDNEQNLLMNAAPPQAFSPDSSRSFYVATVLPQHFLVVDGDESDGFAQTMAPVFGGGGKRIGFIGYDANSRTGVVIDGKATAEAGAHCLSFSPDGAHYAFLAGQDGILYLDGVAQPVVNVNAAQSYLFSPDGKHLVMGGNSTVDPNRRGLFMDGKLIADDASGAGRATRPIFTPDSQHFLWIGQRPTQTNDDRDSLQLYVDGQPAVHFVGYGASMVGNWEMSSDGVLSFIAHTGDAIKRFRVTPSPDASVATLLAHGT